MTTADKSNIWLEKNKAKLALGFSFKELCENRHLGDSWRKRGFAVFLRAVGLNAIDDELLGQSESLYSPVFPMFVIYKEKKIQIAETQLLLEAKDQFSYSRSLEALT